MPSRDLFGSISTADGTHPSAFRETTVDFDKDVKVNVKGLPVCKAGQLEARDTKAALRVCGSTELGTGTAHAEIAFPEPRSRFSGKAPASTRSRKSR